MAIYDLMTTVGTGEREWHSDFGPQYVDECALTWVREHRKEQYLGRNIIVQFENMGFEAPAIDIRIHLIHLRKHQMSAAKLVVSFLKPSLPHL